MDIVFAAAIARDAKSLEADVTVRVDVASRGCGAFFRHVFRQKRCWFSLGSGKIQENPSNQFLCLRHTGSPVTKPTNYPHDSHFVIRTVRVHSHAPFETNFRSGHFLCNPYYAILISTTVFAVTWSGRGGARATNEDSNASLDPPTAALLVMSAAGTDERAPLLLGADAASSGWGWRKRALATIAIVGTLAACACAVAATGETPIDPQTTHASPSTSLPSIRVARSCPRSRRARHVARIPPHP